MTQPKRLTPERFEQIRDFFMDGGFVDNPNSDPEEMAGDLLEHIDAIEAGRGPLIKNALGLYCKAKEVEEQRDALRAAAQGAARALLVVGMNGCTFGWGKFDFGTTNDCQPTCDACWANKALDQLKKVGVEP